MTLSAEAYDQLVGITTGTLLITAVLLVWRRSLLDSVRLLAVQGFALAGLVATIGLAEGDAELLVVAVIVLALKGATIPLVLARSIVATGVRHEDNPRWGTASSLVTVALLTTVAYLVSRPITEAGTAAGEVSGPAAFAVPVGLTMVLIGFLLLATRRHALSQLIAFLLLDNGIATVGFLTAAGVPFIVELGISLDVLLVVVILGVLSGRMAEIFGATDLAHMNELRD